MLPSSLSTSNSETRAATQRAAHGRLRTRVCWIGVWTVAALAGLDLGIGYAFRLPSSPSIDSSPMQRYFDYGRSIEGKLRRLVGRTEAGDAPIVRAGWLSDECDVDSIVLPGRVTFDIYGMSFTNQIADQVEHLDPVITPHRFGGPAAPLNHSYACFVRRMDSGRTMAPIQILGVLASSVSRMQTITGLTTTPEGPEPFTYPRYNLNPSGELAAHYPSIMNANELRAALNDPVKWDAFKTELAINDALYSPVLFSESLLDHSVLMRLIRRAWGQRLISRHNQSLNEADGFSGAPEIAPTFRALIADFRSRNRVAGKQSIILLIEDRGYRGSLEAMTRSISADGDGELIYTSSIVSPDDPGNFLADGHFNSTANAKIARVLLGHLRNAAN